ncbi:hypothetical protein [Parapedobacter sp. 10938]|uniref:hypothetical protein n=1 Tax=Parapedobacter flavus TaxID=3110225 RepID=UPI002DB5BB79|nr:hypothetical protein [Parapedobacter sp. 10938]MEC3881441.1 hypothetical protein [Parapedobacter sp. 10938]
MVKVFTIWLMLVYAFSATGASVHLHYCCGKLQHLTMENEHTTDHDDCTLCLNHHKKKNHTTDCNDSQHCAADVQSHNHCQDIQVDAQKTTGDHLPSSDKNLLKIQSLELLVFSLVRIANFPLENTTAVEMANSPPRVESTPLFIRLCTYRI